MPVPPGKRAASKCRLQLQQGAAKCAVAAATPAKETVVRVGGGVCVGPDDSKCASGRGWCCAPHGEAATCQTDYVPVRLNLVNDNSCGNDADGKYMCCRVYNPAKPEPGASRAVLGCCCHSLASLSLGLLLRRCAVWTCLV